MTVDELVKLLQHYPSDMRVLICCQNDEPVVTDSYMVGSETVTAQDNPEHAERVVMIELLFDN